MTIIRSGPALQVLVVEDDADVAEVLSVVIRRLGHHCRTAASGAAGLASASAHHLDLALIDFGLPDMTGVEVAHRMRIERPDAPVYVVALTGYSPPDDFRSRSLRMAFDEYLVKPIEHATLVKTLARARERCVRTEE